MFAIDVLCKLIDSCRLFTVAFMVLTFLLPSRARRLMHSSFNPSAQIAPFAARYTSSKHHGASKSVGSCRHYCKADPKCCFDVVSPGQKCICCSCARITRGRCSIVGRRVEQAVAKECLNNVVSQCRSTFRGASSLTTTNVGGKNKIVKNVNTIRYLLRILLFWASVIA